MMSFLTFIRKPRSVEALQVDTSMLNYPRRVLNSTFAAVPFQPLADSIKVIAFSRPALSLLVDKTDELPDNETLSKNSELVDLFSGKRGISESGWSHCYWGTQFGNYAGQLGDGAAILVGESRTGFEINLKGSGKTPFSRGFDGRKVVRSSIREFLCSEGMAGLGIPTTRAGSVIMSDTSKVLRDINYTGNPIEENCAVVSRIARTFFRFGSFESDDERDTPAIRDLARYVWRNLLTPLATNENQSFMDVVIDRTAFLVANWQAVGFVHGVLNTDNMSIIGDTIDYGPFGFVEMYDPHFVPNTSDKFGRYALSEQPRVAAGNCAKLNNVLSWHFRGIDQALLREEYGWTQHDDVEKAFFIRFSEYYDALMRQKLGLPADSVPDDVFVNLRDRFFVLLDLSAVDYTVTFSALCDLTPTSVDEVVNRIMSTFPSSEQLTSITSKGLRVSLEDLDGIEEFARTRLSELERAGIDLNTIKRWRHKHERLRSFSDDASTLEVRNQSFMKWRELLLEIAPYVSAECRNRMQKVNPVYIPRQGHIQQVIQQVEDFAHLGGVEQLLAALSDPFIRRASFREYEFPNRSFKTVCLSCSS
jgi:uncharacterized protein YdiU (UPF0061 family)